MYVHWGEGACQLDTQVLIHAGTGGVGQAAVTVCLALGASITATAGSAQKRTFLRASGVFAAAGSRDASFVDVIACRGDWPMHPSAVIHLQLSCRLQVLSSVLSGSTLLCLAMLHIPIAFLHVAHHQRF